MNDDKSYLVHLQMQIHSGFSGASSNDVWMERTIVLPFVPFGGLHYRDGEFEYTFEGGIIWDKEMQEFIHYRSDKELYNAALDGYRISQKHILGDENLDRLAEITAEYESEGWKRRDR